MSTWVARQSTTVIGGVATAQLRQGTAVVLAASGQWNDLPGVAQAASGAVNVYVAIVPPDQFPRPTDLRMYVRTAPQSFSILDTPFVEMVDTADYAKIGKSNLGGIVLINIGELVQCHRGGTYAIPSGSYVYSANLLTPGATVGVGSAGMWQYTTTASAICGSVSDFRDGTLFISIDAKSA